MARDTKRLEISNQQDLLLRIKDIVKGIQKDGMTDDINNSILQAFQSTIRTYQEFLDAQKNALRTADDPKEISRLKMENLNLRQQKLTEQERIQELHGKLISYKHMDQFREFVDEFWKGIKENPQVAARVFGIELGLGDDPSQSAVLTKKVDYIIANFLDTARANENFNEKLTRYANAAGDAETRLEHAQQKVSELEKAVAEARKRADGLQEGFDDVTLKWQDANTELERIEQNLKSEHAQFENIKKDLQSDLNSEKSARQSYEIVYKAVLEILPEEDRKDLPELLQSNDDEIPQVVQTLITSALVKKTELDKAEARSACAEKALEAIFGKEKFREYANLGNVPNEHYIWAVQTFQEAATNPLREAEAEVEKRKEELLEIQAGISDLMLLFKEGSDKKAVGRILAAELDWERGVEQDAGKESAEYILDKIPQIKQKVGELKQAQTANQEQVAVLNNQLADLEAEVEASRVKYEPKPLDAQTLINQARTSKIAGGIYEDENSFLAARAQYHMAEGLYAQALKASQDDTQRADIQKELTICKEKLEQLEDS